GDNVDILENTQPDEGDADHYNAMISYIETHNLSNEEHYEEVKTMMDVDNFIDYQTIEIFSGNTDWPGNNVRMWRLRTTQYQPGAPYGHDGRWRWMLYDTDFGFDLFNTLASDHNTLEFATEENGPGWPNPPWSTFLFRKLLESEAFRTAFINRFDDMLNSAFRPERTTGIIRKMQESLQPEMAEHVARWKMPRNVDNWRDRVDNMITFAEQRPSFQRQHIRDYFGLEHDITLTVNVSD